MSHTHTHTHTHTSGYQNGWTPLMKASFGNYEKIVELLAGAGATLDYLHEV